MSSALFLLLVAVAATPVRAQDDWSRSAEAGRLANSAQNALTSPEPFVVYEFVQPAWQNPRTRAGAVVRLEKKCLDAGKGFHVIGERLELPDFMNQFLIYVAQMCAPGEKNISDGYTRTIMSEMRQFLPFSLEKTQKEAGEALVRQCASKSSDASLLREYQHLSAGVAGGTTLAVGICRYKTNQ